MTLGREGALTVVSTTTTNPDGATTTELDAILVTDMDIKVRCAL